MSKSDSTLIDRKESFAELKHLLVEKNREIEQLKQEINIMQQVMDYLPLRVFWKDKQGIYLGNNRFNLEATKTYCCLREPEKVKNFRGKTDEDLFLSEFAETHRRTDLEVIRTKKALEEEAAFTNYKGCKIIEFDKKAPLFDSRGQVIGVMGYITDVTHLKNLEAKVKNAGLAKIEFIRHMQHDIKTPFAGITGLTNILLDAETDSEKRDFLKDIILCANELMEYCDRILDFSKATVKNLPLTPLTFRLRDIVDSVINMAMPVAKIKRLYLRRDKESIAKAMRSRGARDRRALTGEAGNALRRKVICGSDCTPPRMGQVRRGRRTNRGVISVA